MKTNRRDRQPGKGLGRVGLQRYLCVLGGLTVVGLLAVGCSERPIKYYQVRYPTKTEPGPGAINATITVRPFDASRLYLDNRVVYGWSNSPEIGMYQYHRWVDPPVHILQTELVRGLSASGAFKAVYTVERGSGGRFLLGGDLHDFKEVDDAKIVARLNYDVQLHDRKTGTIIWEYSYNHDEPVAEKTVTSFVIAMEKNLQQSVQQVQTGLEQYFQAHPVE